jgi:DNA polymerase-4
MDAFYAAIEQMDDPRLRGRPVLVGPDSDRGVVLTASYEARPDGVGSAMPMAVARRRCPDAVIVPPRFERYREVSRSIMAVFASFSPRVEALSLDEAFLDMSGAEPVFGAPARIGRLLKGAVRDATGGLTVSVGLSATKFVAKVASDYAKPDGLTVVPPEEAERWLAPLPVSVLWGAGPKTQAALRGLGLNTLGDVARDGGGSLLGRFGKLGARFARLARGDDPRDVAAERESKSLSSELTLAEDIASPRDIEFHLARAAEAVGKRLRRQGLMCRGIRVKLKTSDFRVLSRQRVFTAPIDATADLLRAGAALLHQFPAAGPYRLVGLAAYRLVDRRRDGQLDLAIGAGDRDRRLDSALDAIGEHFGPGAIRSGGELIRTARVSPAVNLDFLKERGDDEGGS